MRISDWSSDVCSSDLDLASENIKVSTDDLAARNLSEKEWLSMSENRLNSQDNQLRRMQGQGDQLEQMQAQIDALRSENSNMASEGTRVLSAYDDENRQLKEQLAAAQASSRPSAGQIGTASCRERGGPYV